jgi:hypothetical protein
MDLASTPAVVRRPSTGGFKLSSARVCFLSTAGSIARALQFAQDPCLRPVAIALTQSHEREREALTNDEV